MEGVCLGEKTSMPETLEKQLQISGLSHITSVSGLHVTVLMSMLFVLLNLFRLNRHKSIWLIGGMILLFMVFAGASPSVVRAVVMGVFMLVGYGFLRHADSLTSLGAAAGVIVLHNPFAAFDVGFILSFGAMLGILLFSVPLQNFLIKLCRLDGRETFGARILKSILSMCSVTLGVQIFVLPLSSWLFGYISLWSILTSILAAPLAPLILVGGLLVSFLGDNEYSASFAPGKVTVNKQKASLSASSSSSVNRDKILSISSFGFTVLSFPRLSVALNVSLDPSVLFRIT